MSLARFSLFAFTAAVLTAAATGCSNQGASGAPDTRAADEAAIRGATTAMEQRVSAKDLDKIVGDYEDNAVLFAPKAPASVGKAAIHDVWQGLLTVPGLKMTLKIGDVNIARSGDLAVERGSFAVDTTDKDGKANTETGQLVIVWRKQADGSWKIVADTNADDK
jgi:ketosteroid isomerase-like protein